MLSLLLKKQSSSTILELDTNEGPDHIPLYLSSTFSFQFIFRTFDNQVDVLLIPLSFG